MNFNLKDKKELWKHRAVAIFQIAFGVIGLIGDILWIAPSGNMPVIICLAVLFIFEIALGTMNIALTTKSSLEKLLRPCKDYLQHQQEAAQQRNQKINK